MDFLKKVNALVLGFVILVTFGCGSDEPEPDDNNPQVQNQKKCYLVKEDSPAELHEYLYDSSNRVRRINRKVSSNGTLLRIDSLDYDNLGNRFRIRQFSSNNILTGFELYEYNADKLLTKVSIYNDSGSSAIQLKGGDIFEYNNLKQLIKRIPFAANQPSGGTYYTYFYQVNGDVTENRFVPQNNIPVLQYSQNYQFTTVKHRFTHLGFLQGYTGVDFLIKPFTSIVRNTSWTLNSEGYPITETFTDIGQNYITTYKYNCQ